MISARSFSIFFCAIALTSSSVIPDGALYSWHYFDRIELSLKHRFFMSHTSGPFLVQNFKDRHAGKIETAEPINRQADINYMRFTG
ncbi:MAG TPA: hypothetical protein VIN59_05670 [Alphaproteobacteria bacterium]